MTRQSHHITDIKWLAVYNIAHYIKSLKARQQDHSTCSILRIIMYMHYILQYPLLTANNNNNSDDDDNDYLRPLVVSRV